MNWASKLHLGLTAICLISGLIQACLGQPPHMLLSAFLCSMFFLYSLGHNNT